MRPLLLLFGLLLTAFALPAQETGYVLPAPPASGKTLPQPRGRVTGKVLLGDSRQPARAATVMLMVLPSKEKSAAEQQNTGRGGMLSARTGMDGSYVIEHVGAGEYGLVAFLPGYLSPFDGLTVNPSSGSEEEAFRSRLSGQNLIHVPQDSSVNADLTLERGAAVSGRVLYSDGAPVTQAAIEVEDVAAKTPPKGKEQFQVGFMIRSLFTHQNPATDDQGRFRITGLQPGSYRVAVMQELSFADMANGGADEGMVMGLLGGVGDPRSLHYFAGDTIHRKAAKVFDLRAGDTADGIEIRIPIDGFHAVNVRLTATDGRPVNRAELTLADSADESLVFMARSRGEGLFVFDQVPPGTYTVTAKGATIAAEPYGPPTAAFAEGSAAVIVKDSEPGEVLLSLKEIALPKPDPSVPHPTEQ